MNVRDLEQDESLQRPIRGVIQGESDMDISENPLVIDESVDRMAPTGSGSQNVAPALATITVTSHGSSGRTVNLTAPLTNVQLHDQEIEAEIMKLTAKTVDQEHTINRHKERLRDTDLAGHNKARAAAIKDLTAEAHQMDDQSLKVLLEAIKAAAKSTRHTKVSLVVSETTAKKVIYSGEYITGADKLRDPSIMKESHSGAGLDKKVNPWSPLQTTKPKLTPTEGSLTMHRIIQKAVDDRRPEGNENEKAGESIARTSEAMVRNCETLLLMDDTVSPRTYNGYLHAACTQIVVPAANTEQLLNVAANLVSGGYLEKKCKRVILVSGKNEWNNT